MRKSWWAGSFLDGINAASLGLMAAVAIQLGRVVLIDWFTILIMIGALFLLLKFKLSSVWLVLGGGALGVIYKLIIG
jgi:chromate transporter